MPVLHAYEISYVMLLCYVKTLQYAMLCQFFKLCVADNSDNMLMCTGPRAIEGTSS